MDKNKLMYEMAKQKVSILDMCHKLNIAVLRFTGNAMVFRNLRRGRFKKLLIS